jgi:hypothetical protein
MLLLDRVEFDPGCLVFELEQPLLLRTGDRLWADGGRLVVERASGARHYPAGSMSAVTRSFHLS